MSEAYGPDFITIVDDAVIEAPAHFHIKVIDRHRIEVHGSGDGMVTVRTAYGIKKYPLDTCSVYISIPFCPTRCSYCSFVSFTTKKLLALIPAYLEALKVELSLIARQIKDYIDAGQGVALSLGELADQFS